MKRFACLLLALFLPLTALAETIAEQMHAPEHITDTLWSNTGKTEITVDADVLVPQVSAVPLWEVTSTYFTIDEVLATAQKFVPEARIEQYMNSGFGNDMLELVPGDYSTLKRVNETLALMQFSSEPVGQRTLDGSALYQRNDLQQAYHMARLYMTNHRLGVYTGDGQPYDIEGEGIPGNALTTREAIAKADAFMAEIMPGFTMRWVGRSEGSTFPKAAAINGVDFDLSSIPDSVPDGYKLTYTRTLSGIPVNYSCWETWRDDMYDSYGYPPGYENWKVVLDDLGEIVQLSANFPYIVGDQVAEDCELMPFEQIWQIFREVAPLSIMYQESEGNVQASINRIDFGYMPIRQQDGGFLLSPVWDFYGTKMRRGITVDWQGSSVLTIDAVTGLVIDREYGY